MKTTHSFQIRLVVALVWLAASGMAFGQRQPVNMLTQFGPLDGQMPVGGLTVGPGGFFFGVTADGGQNRDGAFFRFRGAAATQIVASFGTARTPGAKPSGQLLRAPDGRFYGVTENGGASGIGAVVRYTSAGAGELLASFNGAGLGSRPTGWLVRDKAGNFYGVCREGGLSGHGTVFKMDKTGAVTRLVSFSGTAGAAPGRRLTGGLVLVGDDLFGVAEEGGGSDRGVVFKVSTAGDFSLVHTFTGTGPRKPVGGLVLGPDKLLYGVTETGSGAETPGVIFRITAGGTLEVVKVFTGTDGATPGGALVLGANNTLYGTTRAGGAFGHGLIFSLKTDGIYAVLNEFTGIFGVSPGSQPVGRLLSRGPRLYGVTREGGELNAGTVFEVTTAGSLRSLYAFRGSDLLGGYRPNGAMARGSDGSWYGVTRRAGGHDVGTVFKMTAKGKITPLFAFTGVSGGFPGATPLGGLVAGPDGRFYGTTSAGGSTGGGTVFAVSARGEHEVLHEFANVADNPSGIFPEGALIVAADGRLVGTARSGGTSNSGVVYAISTTGVLEVVANLHSIGKLPREIMQAPDGTFYGVFEPTGNLNRGLFKLTSGGILSTLVSFTGNAGAFPGQTPQGAPILMPDGNLYGVTMFGGSTGRGVIYRVTTTGDYEVLRTITSNEGWNPIHGLTLGSDGWLYGMLLEFGTSNRGCVFRVNMDGDYQRLKRWAAHEGQRPGGLLVRDPQGRLFGVTEFGGRGSAHRSDGQGGPTGAGTVFFVDPRIPIPLPQVTVLPPTKITRHPTISNVFSAFLRARANPRGFPTTLNFSTVRSDSVIGGQGTLELPGRAKAITTGKTTDVLLFRGYSHTVRVTATNEFGSTVAEWSPLIGFNQPPTAQDRVLAAPAPAMPTEIYKATTHTTDPDGTPRTLSIAAYSGAGTVTTDGSTVTYTGTAFTGVEIVTIRVQDDGGGSVFGHVTLVSGTATPNFLALGSTKGGVGTRVGAIISSTHSFGTPTQFGESLVNYGRLFFDTSSATATKPKWTNFPMLMQVNPPWHSTPGVSIHPDSSAVLDAVTDFGYAAFGEFAGRTTADRSESVSAFPVALFGGDTNSGNNRAIVTRIVRTATSTNERFLLARTGDPAPGTGGAFFNAFTGLLVPDTTSLPVVVAKLRSAPGVPVNKTNDTGVWGDNGLGVFGLLLRTGDSIAGAAPAAVVSAITLPQTVPGSPAERRHESGPSLLPMVTFTDNSKALLSLTPDETPAIIARTGTEDAQGRELLALRFGDFSVVGGDAQACFFAQWRPGKGGVTVNDDTAILLSDGTTPTVLAREGDEPPDLPGLQFASFNDPLAATEPDTAPFVAFEATVRGANINNSNHRGLWVYPREGMDPPYLLARSGDAAPDAGGALFDKFDTMASLADLDMGLAFTASLRGSGVNKGNNYGLWASDDGGAPVLLFRTGQQIAAKNTLRRVKAFTVMKGVPVSPGQERTTSPGVNALALRVAFTDGTTALLSVFLP